MKQFLFTMLCFCVGVISYAQQLYVAPNGSDLTGQGTVARPYASLQKAYDKAVSLRGNDTVRIQLAPGRYPLSGSIKMDKSPVTPLVIEGAPGGKTILSGAVRVTHWQKMKNGWWIAYVEEVEKEGWQIEQLYVNGRRAQRARTPDEGWCYIEDSDEWPVEHPQRKGMGIQRFHVTPRLLSSLKGMRQEELGDVAATFFHKWSNTRQYLTRAVPDSGYIFTKGPLMPSWNPITRGSRFVLENYKGALTAPGEWFIDRKGHLFYIPREGENIDKIEAFAPVVEQLLRVQGYPGAPVKNITFRHLTFEHAANVMPREGNKPEQAAADIQAAVSLGYVENVHLEQLEVRHTGNYAVGFEKGCQDCSLVHSFLADLGAGGVRIGATYMPSAEGLTRRILVENNIIQQTGQVFPSGAGIIIFNAADNRILHNDISNILYTGISVGWNWGYNDSYAVNNEIAYNHIHHLGWGKLSDMGGIYTLGKSPGTRIHHNVLHDIYSYDYGGWGLYTDEGSSDIVLENNLVYACKSGAFHQHYGKDNVVRNNIFAFSQYFQLQLSKAEAHRSFTFSNNIILADCGTMLMGNWRKAKIDFGRNLYWDLRTDSPAFLDLSFEKWKAEKRDPSILVNPMFVNPRKGDFHFKSRRNIRKIGFRPFDYTEAGVYGSQEWKRRACLSSVFIRQFRKMVVEKEKDHSGYYD